MSAHRVSNAFDEIRAIAATGIMGSGFLAVSLERALEWEPHFIGCDAGTTDLGPYYLGSGEMMFSRAACKRDFRLMLQAARSRRIPLLIGSCGTAGGDPHLEWMAEIAREVAREEELHFRLALIRSEQDKEYIKRRLREGRIRPLFPALDIDEAVIDRSVRIVGMMGAEPFAQAIVNGADVVLAGRSSDTSIYAALPLAWGMPPGPVWHAAKIMECGTAAVTQRVRPDCMFARIRRDHFILEPPNPAMRCTALSVAAHTLYENNDPCRLYEPSGMLDTTEAHYEAVSDRAVKVSGSRFIPAERYTIKLEGVELVGYQSLTLGGIRDPVIIRQIDEWLKSAEASIRQRIKEIFADTLRDDSYVLNLRLYGKNGTMGALEPIQSITSHELCLVIEVTAGTQELASSIVSSATHIALHHPVPEWDGIITALAIPYSPLEIARGPVYRFNMNHVLEPDNPCEMFPTQLEDL